MTADAQEFVSALQRRAKIFAPSATATFEANQELCSWLLDPLARWTEAAYGEQAFDEAALGYAKYCLGVAQAQQIYERTGKYTPEAMPEIVSGPTSATVAVNALRRPFVSTFLVR